MPTCLCPILMPATPGGIDILTAIPITATTIFLVACQSLPRMSPPPLPLSPSVLILAAGARHGSAPRPAGVHRAAPGRQRSGVRGAGDGLPAAAPRAPGGPAAHAPRGRPAAAPPVGRPAAGGVPQGRRPWGRSGGRGPGGRHARQRRAERRVCGGGCAVGAGEPPPTRVASPPPPSRCTKSSPGCFTMAHSEPRACLPWR